MSKLADATQPERGAQHSRKKATPQTVPPPPAGGEWSPGELKVLRQASSPTLLRRAMANMLRGRAAKTATTHGRAAATAAGSGQEEIHAAVDAACRAVMRRPLEEFMPEERDG